MGLNNLKSKNLKKSAFPGHTMAVRAEIVILQVNVVNRKRAENIQQGANGDLLTPGSP